MAARDLIGYGRHPINPRWPGDARVAVQFVINYEEGGEKSILYGDKESESFLAEQPTAPLIGLRNLSVESQYEYGSRAGFWRLHRLFTERNLPVTVYGVATALAQNPPAVAAMREAAWEIASHGMRWISYAEFSAEDEAREIDRAIALHTEATGERPRGWYTGRMTLDTRRLLVRAGGFLYDSNTFSDDLPYWVEVEGQHHLVIPYTLDNNDMRYVNTYGFESVSFSSYLIQAFELLRREGTSHPKMMSIGLHNRIVGRPGRAADLERFLDHVAGAEDAWITRRIDIAAHWHAEHAP